LGSPTLRVAHEWHDPARDPVAFLDASRQASFGPGDGLPGRVWDRGEPIWLPDLGTDPALPRAEGARAAGLHGALAFPITAGRTGRGVVEFLSAEVEEPDAALLETTASIGSQLGQFIERTEAEAELRASEARNRTLVESTPVVSYTNAIGRPSECRYISPQI